MLAVKAIVKDGLIKPLEAIDLPEKKEIVIYISEEKVVEEEYSGGVIRKDQSYFFSAYAWQSLQTLSNNPKSKEKERQIVF